MATVVALLLLVASLGFLVAVRQEQTGMEEFCASYRQFVDIGVELRASSALPDPLSSEAAALSASPVPLVVVALAVVQTR